MDLKQDQFYPPMTKYLLLVLLIFIGMLLSYLLRFGLEWAYASNLQEVYQSLSPESSASERYFVRWGILSSHLMTFAGPAIVLAIVLYRDKWAHSLDLQRPPRLYNIATGCLLILAAFPLAQFALWLNQQIPLPEWAISIEDTAQQMIDGLLQADNPLELLSNLLVIALVPAIGEELIFRGIIQRGFYGVFRHAGWAIWIAAFLFSAFHLQLEGFLARLLLGAVLGYLYYWSGNLWVCIAAHFANNGVQILAQYAYAEEVAAMEIENSNAISWPITIISLIFVLTLASMMINYNRNNQRG